jgi:hypothetical protein
VGRRAAIVGRTVAVIVGTFLLAGCGAVEPPPSPLPSTSLSPPTFEAIGILADERISDPDRTYVLADGRSFDVSMVQTRMLFDDGGGVGQPFIKGRDETGPFVGIFGLQDGLPDGCYIPGIGARGIDRGIYIEIKGVLWRKAPSFDPASAPGSNGTPYPSSTRFCFDDQARVTATVP